MPLPVHIATRYVVPLREGGSLPAIVETASGDMFVVKFRGAGQGARALVAEIIGGLLAQRLGLPTPDLALLDLDASFGRTERDPEIQDILKASVGLNMGARYLDGAFNYESLAAADLVEPDLAAQIVWFDAFITNIDRTPRNPNILLWDRAPWLIDHGASLYFHHDWSGVTPERARTPFAPIKDHVLLRRASSIIEAEATLSDRLSPDFFREVLEAVPDELLMDAVEGRTPPFPTAEANREAYYSWLTTRFAAREAFTQQAEHARLNPSTAEPRRRSYRR